MVEVVFSSSCWTDYTMPRGPMRNYGRTVVVDSELIFDNIILEQAKSRARTSPFCSSDSSHTSSLNCSVSQPEEHSSLGLVTRQARKTRADEKMKSLKSKSSSSHKENHSKKSNNSSSLFHEDSSSIVLCTPVKKKQKPQSVLKENNSQPVIKHKTRAKPVQHKEKKVLPKQTKKREVCVLENVPDFDDIEQDDLIIDVSTSTPRVPENSTSNNLGHNVSIFNSSPLNVSLIHVCENSDLRHSANASELLEQKGANVTFRRGKHTFTSQTRLKKSENKRSPDSGNLSDDCTASDSYEHTDSSAHLSESVASMMVNNCSQSVRESSMEDASSSACEDFDYLTNSFHMMRLRSRDIAERLANRSQSSLNQESNMEDGDEYTEAPGVTGSPLLFDDSSSCRSHDKHSPLLPLIAEEDYCYSEDEEEDDEIEVKDDENEDEQENSLEENEEEGTTEQPRCSNRSDITLYELTASMSFSEKLSNSSLCKDVSVTAQERVLSLCGQTEPISFSDCVPPRMMSRCVKIGEGVYGEVFRTFSGKDAVALKIIPIEGDQEVNDCPQKKFEEILPEVVIAKELSDLKHCQTNQSSSFCQVKRISCVQGAFPSKLLEQWDAYSQNKVSENDRPDMFPSDQLFIVFEFIDGGCPLENYKFKNHMEAFSVLRQVVFALAVAENELEFEHRDLHIGNVLVRPCVEETVSFKLQDRHYQFPTEGVIATIIDFTISRLKRDGCAVFCDVSTDEGLFQGTGDFQFDVYRAMRKENENDWKRFCPYTNVLWVNYICKKFLTAIKYKETGRDYRDVQRHLRSLADSLLDYSSCLLLTVDTMLWELAV